MSNGRTAFSLAPECAQRLLDEIQDESSNLGGNNSHIAGRPTNEAWVKPEDLAKFLVRFTGQDVYEDMSPKQLNVVLGKVSRGFAPSADDMFALDMRELSTLAKAGHQRIADF